MKTISLLSLVCVVSSCSKSASSTTSPEMAQEASSAETPVSVTPTENVVQGIPEAKALAFFKAVQGGDPASVLPFLPMPNDCQYMMKEMAKDGAEIEKCHRGITRLRKGIAQWLPRATEEFKGLKPTGVVALTKVPGAPKWGYQVSIDIENSPPLRLIAAFKFENEYRFFLGMKKSVPAPAPDTTTAVQEPADETWPAQELTGGEYDPDGTEPLVDGTMHFGSIAMKVLVPQPKEGRPVVATLRIGTGSSLTIGFRKGNYGGDAKVVAEKLPGFATDRLVMVQLFLENGEDVFSREMVTALVFLGNAATKPKVLWQGEGSYQNLFGQCETLNVVSFVPFKGGKVNVMRHREVIVNAEEDGYLMGDAKDCVAKPKSIKRIGRVKIP